MSDNTGMEAGCRNGLRPQNSGKLSRAFCAAGVAFCAVLLFWVPTANARQDIVPGSRYISSRGAAMGDAYLPLGEDGASALFYNPATLGKIRSGNLEPANLSLLATPGFMKTFGTNTPKILSLSSYAPTLTGYPNQVSGFGGQYAPSFYTRGFAVGVLIQSLTSAVYTPDQVLNYRAMYRFVPSAGTAIRLADGIVRIGYSIQWVNQTSGSVDATTTTTPLGYTERMRDGFGFSHTLGYALTLPYKFLPSFNLVVRNLFTTKYGGRSLLFAASNPAGRLATEPMSMDASLSMTPRVGGSSFLTMVAQYRDLTNTSGVSVIGRASLGVELGIKERVYFRGGIGSGYPSLGFGLKSKTGELGISWFSEEIGSGYHSVRDPKIMFQYQMRVL